MWVQSRADMLRGPGAREPTRVLVSTALPDGRSRAKRTAERQKRPAERERRRAEPTAAADPFDAVSAPDPGLALASTLAHLALTAVRDVQVSRSAALEAYAEMD